MTVIQRLMQLDQSKFFMMNPVSEEEMIYWYSDVILLTNRIRKFFKK